MNPTEKIVTPWGVDCVFYDESEANSGRLYTCEEGEKMQAQATVSPEFMLSKIAQGFDEREAGLLRGDAKPLVISICLNYLQRRKVFCNDEREKRELEIQVRQLTRAGGKVELLETYFKSISRTLGARGVAELANLMETVERKSRKLTPKEKNFIKALEEAAIKAKGVPYQKDVLSEWFILDSTGNDNTFHTLKKRLGFGWLPAGTRGKKGVQK